MSYGLFVDCIATVFAKASPSSDPNALSAVFISRGQVMDVLAKLGRSRAGAERAIDGFSITAAHLLAEGGVVSKAKQENRAYRRAFFVFPHESGAELAFYREMARENIIQLVNGVCYKELSAEWTTSATRIALDHLSNAAGDWFEEVVLRNLKTLGIVGRRRQSTIGETGRSVQIPDSVGELDFFGFHPQQRLLVLVDYKMVMSGVDPSDWRDDLDRFVLGPDSYAERFRRKLAWVKENLPAIAASLGCPAATRLGAAMLTLYPCIAGTVIHDFPCVSVTEFMLDYQENSQWPYQRA